MRAADHTMRDPIRLLKRLHCLAEITERGAGVLVERLRVNCPHYEREHITLSQRASRHGYCFTKKRPGFFEAL